MSNKRQHKNNKHTLLFWGKQLCNNLQDVNINKKKKVTIKMISNTSSQAYKCKAKQVRWHKIWALIKYVHIKLDVSVFSDYI